MNPIRLPRRPAALALALAAALAAPAFAADITQTASDAFGTNSFTDGTNFPGGPPVAGNNYFTPGGATANFNLRTPFGVNANGPNDSTFAGDALTLGSNAAFDGALLLKNATGSTVTVNNLTLDKGRVQNGGDQAGLATEINLNGNGINVLASGGVFDSGAVGRVITVNQSVNGAGSVQVVGAGTIALPVASTYAGSTVVNGGALRANDGVGIPASSALTLTGAVLEGTGSFARPIGTGPGQVAASAFSGFSAFGGDLTVNVGGAGQTIVFDATPDFAVSNLTLNRSVGAGTLTFVNPLDLNGASRTIYSGNGTVILSGGIGNSGAAGNVLFDGVAGSPTGQAGVITLTAASTYGGNTEIDPGAVGGGVVRAAATNALGTGVVDVGPGGNATQARLELTGGITLPNTVTFRGRNNDSVSVLNVAGDNAITGPLNVTVGGNRYWLQSDSGTLTLAGGIAKDPLAGGTRALQFRGAGNITVSGPIAQSDAVISVTKVGAGTTTFNGGADYTGGTTIGGGTLRANTGSSAAVLGGAGVDVQNGRLVIDYGDSGSPAPTIVPILDAGFDANFQTGQVRSTTAVANSRGLGYRDTGTEFQVAATLYGDADLNFAVNFPDLAAVALNYNVTSGKVWSEGDFNYDGGVTFADLALVALNYLGTVSPLQAQQLEDVAGDAFLGQWALAVAAVPEPATFGAVAAAGALALVRRRRA